MGREFITDGLTVGYVLALSQFVMTWVLGWMYLRRANRVFDPLAERAREARLRAPDGHRRAGPPLQARRDRGRARTHERGGAAPMTLSRRSQRDRAGGLRGRRRRDDDRHLLSRRSASPRPPTSGPRAAGSPGRRTGFAIAGDYMSAASFLGIAGLIFLFGFDGFLYSVGFLVAFLAVLFLLAEQMRNSGKYTFADVLAYRLKQPPARAAAALGTLSVVAFYLIAQMVGAGVIIEGLVGISFPLAVILTGAFMIIYIVAGRHARDELGPDHQGGPDADLRRRADRLGAVEIGWNPIDLFRDARAESAEGDDYLKPGLFLADAARHGLARPRAGARHGGPAAHPDAVLHRAERQGGAQRR